MPEGELETGAVATRPFWSGTITFGLVSVPVDLLPANRSAGASLRMVSPEGTPLSRRYVTTRDEKPLDWDDIVRGYEVEKDRFVVVEDDELGRLAPERTRDIELRLFVKTSQIDPIHFERAYFLVPGAESTKAYRLLATVMEESDRAGIATFVMRGKEYLVAILAENGILRAETLRFADEIRTPDQIGLPEPIDPPAAAVRRIERQIEKLTRRKLDPAELQDSATQRLLKLVNKKLRTGDDVVQYEPPEEQSEDVLDLVAILQRSLDQGGEIGRPKRSPGAALEKRSKSELYERAKELDIPGRGGMNKKELIEAIRRGA